MYLKANRSIPTTYRIASMRDALENIIGLYPEDPEKIKKALEEYKTALLNAQSDEEMKQAEKTFQVNTKEEYVQMHLADLFPESGFQVQKKK